MSTQLSSNIVSCCNCTKTLQHPFCNVQFQLTLFWELSVKSILILLFEDTNLQLLQIRAAQPAALGSDATLHLILYGPQRLYQFRFFCMIFCLNKLQTCNHINSYALTQSAPRNSLFHALIYFFLSDITGYVGKNLQFLGTSL